MKTILILGGYGGVGSLAARLLLQETTANIILAGRDSDKASKAAGLLNAEFKTSRVTWRLADAADAGNLAAALEGADLLFVCSTTARYAEQIARTALSHGVDYMDVYGSHKVMPILVTLNSAIKNAGRCFITQAGFHPGLIAPFVRYSASFFSQCSKVAVAMVINAHEKASPQSIKDLAEVIAESKSCIFKDGQWRPAVSQDNKKIDFGPDFGVRTSYPMWFEEMRFLPEELRLKELGAYVAGENWFVDNLIIRPCTALSKLRDGLGTIVLAKLLILANDYATTKPPYGVVFKSEAEGRKDGCLHKMEITARHESVFAFTVIPSVACLLQYLDGSIRKPGLWLMGNIINPKRLLNDMERMGAKINIRTKEVQM